MKIENLRLSVRTQNALKSGFVGDPQRRTVKDIAEGGITGLHDCPGLGHAGLLQLCIALAREVVRLEEGEKQ